MLHTFVFPFQQHLNETVFEELFGMNKEAFEEVPKWKQLNLKKKVGLF